MNIGLPLGKREEPLMPAQLAQQDNENGHRRWETRECDEVILRASHCQPSQPSQRAQSARSTFA